MDGFPISDLSQYQGATEKTAREILAVLTNIESTLECIKQSLAVEQHKCKCRKATF